MLSSVQELLGNMSLATRVSRKSLFEVAIIVVRQCAYSSVHLLFKGNVYPVIAQVY